MSAPSVELLATFRDDITVIDDLPLHEFDSRDEALLREHAEETRPELYALIALAAEDVVVPVIKTVVDRPPFGLIDMYGEPVEKIRNYRDLDMYIEKTLIDTYEATRATLPPERERIYTRLGYLCTAIFSHTVDDSRYESADRLLQAGIRTASEATTDSIQAIERIVRHDDPDASAEDVISVARNSGILINRVASVNINHLGSARMLVELMALESGLESSAAQVRPLELKTRYDGRRYVDFTQPVTQNKCPYNFRQEEYVGQIAVQYETLKCPASYKLNGVSPVDMLWSWVVDIVEASGIAESDETLLLPQHAVAS